MIKNDNSNDKLTHFSCLVYCTIYFINKMYIAIAKNRQSLNDYRNIKFFLYLTYLIYYTRIFIS